MGSGKRHILTIFHINIFGLLRTEHPSGYATEISNHCLNYVLVARDLDGRLLQHCRGRPTCEPTKPDVKWNESSNKPLWTPLTFLDVSPSDDGSLTADVAIGQTRCGQAKRRNGRRVGDGRIQVVARTTNGRRPRAQMPQLGQLDVRVTRTDGRARTESAVPGETRALLLLHEAVAQQNILVRALVVSTDVSGCHRQGAHIAVELLRQTNHK